MDVAVLDWYRGQLVAAVGGRRGEYRPLAECYPATAGRSALELARALRERFQIQHIYLADLDAILTGHTAGGWQLARSLLEDGLTVWLDQGAATCRPAVRDHVGGGELRSRLRPILPSEAFVSSAQLLATLEEQPDPAAWTVSLDLALTSGSWSWFRSQPPSERSSSSNTASSPGAVQIDRQDQDAWADTAVTDLVRQTVARGVSRYLVLNLADIGGRGTSTGPLLRQLRAQHPEVELLAGGGIRDHAARQQLWTCGADYLLIGSWFWLRL